MIYYPINDREPWTTSEDANHITSTYEALQNKLPGIDSKTLVGNMEWRIYTEWCMGEGRGSQHLNYQGNGFTSWIGNETHLALERFGAQWIDETFSLPFGMTHTEVRDRVIAASVLRSVDFFSRCRDYRWVQEGSSENLRTSLRDYL